MRFNWYFPKARFFGHRDVDISNENAVMRLVKQEGPSVLINAAAYTDVDGCEDNRDLAFAVNGEGPGYHCSCMFRDRGNPCALQH